MVMMRVSLPEPPYYAVVFTSDRASTKDDGYAAMATRMEDLAREQPGFLGIESARAADGVGITVSYWADLESIRAWKEQVDHRDAQELGRARWYSWYRIRIARVERAYGFERPGR